MLSWITNRSSCYGWFRKHFVGVNEGCFNSSIVRSTSGLEASHVHGKVPNKRES